MREPEFGVTRALQGFFVEPECSLWDLSAEECGGREYSVIIIVTSNYRVLGTCFKPLYGFL